MKRLLFALLILLFFRDSLPAQQSATDSLLALIRTDKEDTVKVNHFIQLILKLRSSNTDTSILLSNQALQLAEKIDWEKGMAKSYYQLSVCNLFKGQYDTTVEFARKALDLSRQIKYASGEVSALSILGLAYSNKGDYIKGLDFHLSALKADEDLQSKNGMAIDLGNIGIVYQAQGDYSKALDFFLQALKIAEELGDKNGMATHLGNIGLVYNSLGNDEKALEYYFKALKIAEELGDKYITATNLGNIGLSFSRQGNYDMALEYYFKALKMDESFGNQNGVSRHLGNIGEIYYDQNDYANSLDYFTRALKATEEQGDKEQIAFWHGSIGKVFMKTGKFSEAETELKKAIAIQDTIGSKDNMRQFEETLSRLYDTTGKYKLALLHYRKAIELKDTLFNEEKNKEITRKEMNYEFEKKEAAAKADQDKKDALALKELQKQKLVRNSFVGGFAIVLLFAGVFFRQRNRIKEGKKRSDELLLNILPEEVAEELKENGKADAKQFDEVTVMFTDFKNFTQFSEKLSPAELVNEIDYCFKAFDTIISKYNIEKIKTIGDSYMCAGGLPVANETNATDVVGAALEIQNFMYAYFRERTDAGEDPIETRIGIHTGPVVAGIVGIKKFAYDIWGDTVNIASRMESSGEAGKVNISDSTYSRVKDQFRCTHRGKVLAKNKGEIDMYFVESAN